MAAVSDWRPCASAAARAWPRSSRPRRAPELAPGRRSQATAARAQPAAGTSRCAQARKLAGGRCSTWHVAAITLLEDEIRRDAPGQQTLLDRLLDLNLVFALRAWWARADVSAPGWYRAMSDPGLRRVLEQVHAAPGRDWTVPAMASLAGLSRAAFTARLSQLIGQSPGRYLTELRMQRAEDALVRSKATLAEIAAAVGYQNEYAFAAAFRRHRSMPPGKWHAQAES